MALNRSEIRNEIRRLLAESSISASYFSDADINAAINAGIKDICIVGRVYEKSATISVTTGDPTYDLASDFLEIKAVYDAAAPGGNLLDRIEPEHVNRLFIVTGDPLYYYIFNKGGATDFEITFVDTPTTGGGGTGTYQYKYYALDADLTADTGAGSTPAIPEEFHRSLAYYAAFQMALKGKDVGQASAFYAMYASSANIILPGEAEKETVSTGPKLSP